MRQETKKRPARAAALTIGLILLLLALYVGTTFAKQDAGTDDGTVFYKARLVDEFDGRQAWVFPDMQAEKRISVLNPGNDGDGADDRAYGPVFARIQLKEFMELYGEARPVYTVHRYMLDTAGRFLSFAAQADAEAYCTGKDLGARSVDQIRAFGQAEAKWYIRTKENDPNGVYGNFIVLDYETTQNKNLIELNPPAKADMDAQRAEESEDCMWQDEPLVSVRHRTAACDYTVRRWQQGLETWEVNGPGKPSFADYVAWTYGKDVILFSEWDGRPCDKWIVDDSPGNTEGWVYWGSAIAPGQQTGDFITALRRMEALHGSAYYALHTDMEAVSYDELTGWTEANDPKGSGNDKIVEALLQSLPVNNP